jgi:hypothetical protein
MADQGLPLIHSFNCAIPAPIHTVINKLKQTVITGGKPKWVLIEEKSDEIGVRLQHSPQKSHRYFAQGTRISHFKFTVFWKKNFAC